MTVAPGDFNVKSKNWCKPDITSFKGSMIVNIEISYGLNKAIQESTHILNWSSSCIDLIFISQPNLVMESQIHSSVHSNCHHQIAFEKFCLFSILHLAKELFGIMKKLVRKTTDKFDWLRALSNVKVSFFTKTMLNIIQNFIPHESIICYDRDPLWINKKLKKLMVGNNFAFKLYCFSNKSMFFFKKSKALQS